MNIATTLIIAVVAVVALYFLVKKFPALERALFVSKNDPEANAWLDTIDPFAPDFNPSKLRAEIIERILRVRGLGD